MILDVLQRHSFFVVIAFALLVFGAPNALGQTDRATLEGTITDTSGATISGAMIHIVAVATGIASERTSDGNGLYRFPAIAVGEYEVSVTNSGFKTKELEHVVLEVGETHTLDITLDVGQASETVRVTAEQVPAERSTAAASTVIRGDQIANLPVNGRDWSALTLLAPFAQDDGGGDQRTIRFAGRARDDNNFTFDGVDAGGIQEQAQKSQVRLQISEDAVAEYRVNSALYDAEYGTQAGGQINVETKSGTNDLHGTAFGYLRNSVFDARNFTDPATIPPFRLGQYGMTVGGPIKKDKTFFFLSYEGLRQLQENTTNGLTFVPSTSFLEDALVNGRTDPRPTPPALVGPSPSLCSILQAFPWHASAGTIGGCKPLFTFPDSDFTPLTPDEAAAVPAGSLPSDIEHFTHNVQTTVHEDTWLIRIDHKFSDKTTLYGRAQRDISLVKAPNGSTADVADTVRTINHPANYFLALQHVFSSNLLNEVKVYINRAPFHNPQSSPLPYAVAFNEFTQINDDTADIEVGTTYGLIDSLTWSHGRHTFKAGMEIRRVRLNQGQTADNTLTFGENDDVIAAQLSGIVFNAPWCCHRLRRTFYMPYFQDEWKITPTLTVNAGVRYEYYGVAHEATNRTTVFDLNQFHGVCLGSGSFNVLPTNPNDPSQTLIPIDTPACPKNPSLYNPDYKNLDPRLSVAWAPSALHGKTVIRSGFGIYHGAAQNDDLNAGLESDTFRASVTPATTIAVVPGFQQDVPDLTAVNGVVKAAQHPRALQREGRLDLYAEEWGLTVDHELPAGFLFSASYLGSRGVHLFSRGAVNLCTIPVTLNASGSDCIRPLDKFYPDPADPTNPTATVDPFGSVDFKSDTGTSSYNALGLTLERRFNNGFSFQARYTLAHSINDGSVGGGESNGPENVDCRQCDKGPSVFDVRHNVTVNSVYDLPFGRGKAFLHDGGLEDRLFGGWSLSGIGIWHTGHPLTVVMNLNGSDTLLLPDGNDQTTQRPDIVPGVPLTLPGGGHNGVPLINPAAFQAPPTDANGNFVRFGDEPNGALRALPTWQIDLALMKETKLTERFSLEFGIQAFNIFNHTQLGDPATLALDYDPASSTSGFLDPEKGFGVINGTVNFNNNNDNAASPNTGTGLPRQLQFMLRVKF
jgi:Carboxypeptidase regulatory-like domain/TonB dependent receptor-like, beta-barrel